MAIPAGSPLPRPASRPAQVAIRSARTYAQSRQGDEMIEHRSPASGAPSFRSRPSSSWRLSMRYVALLVLAGPAWTLPAAPLRAEELDSGRIRAAVGRALPPLQRGLVGFQANWVP